MRFGSNSVIDWDEIRRFDSAAERIDALRVYARAYEAHRVAPGWVRLVCARIALRRFLRALPAYLPRASLQDVLNMASLSVGFALTMLAARLFCGF